MRGTMIDLRHKVALVTGSSRGIGAAIARAFAAHGAKVALTGRDEAALSAVRESIASQGGMVMQVPADVTQFDQIEKARETVEQTLGPIDVLIANAGANLSDPRLPLEQITEEAFRASVADLATGKAALDLKPAKRP